MAWQALTLPKTPSLAASAVDAVKSLASTLSTVATAEKTAADVLSNLVIPNISLTQKAIQQGLQTITSALESLLKDTGVYVLLVPPRSKVLIPPVVKAVLSSTYVVSPTTGGLNTQALFSGVATSPQERAILDSLFTANGGNAGFVRAVSESFDDVDDASRPVLADTDAVAGLYIVAGGADISAVMSFTNGLSALLTPGRPSALDVPAIPTPQNLTAKVVAGSDVLLQWQYQNPLVDIPTLATFAKITEVAVIRSTSVSLLTAATPQALFGSSALSVGMTSADGAATVVAVNPYTGTDFKNTYLDTTAHVPGSGYYYTVSYHIKLGTGGVLSTGGGVDIGFPRFSNVAKVYLSQVDHGSPRSIAGTPPDWYRTPRAVDLFPALGELLDQVAALATQFGDVATGYGELLKSYVQMLAQQITIYQKITSQLSAVSLQLNAFGSLNLGSARMRTFSGTGGIPFIKKDLVQAFGDTSDPNRPPFDNDEFVAGVVVLATTPDAATMLSTLMGNLNQGTSTVAAALTQIDVQLAPLETAVFSATPTTPLPQIGPGGYCYQSYQPSTSFADNFTPTS